MSPHARVPLTTVLRLEGRDALTLLHRISTQALLDLCPDHARATLFCDFRGRLLHRAVVAVTSDGAVWLLRPDAAGAELAAFIDRHVFRDEVAIADRSSELEVIEADGSPGGAEVEERDGIPTRVAVDGAVWLVAGAGESVSTEREARERRRIQAGRAAHGREIAEAFTPYEVGLAADVHLDKGCYTGQEALQRLITYGSVRRALVRVESAGETPALPAAVRRAGEVVGVLTSAVASEMPGRWIGLAVVKKELATGEAHDLEVGGSALTPEPLPPACPAGLGEARR